MRTSLSLFLIAGFASTALADVPTALERVPIDTPMVVAMDRISSAKESLQRVSHLLDGPKVEGEEGFFEPLNKLLALPGLSAEGSAAVLMYPKAQPHQAGEGNATRQDAKDDKGGDEFFDEEASESGEAGADFLEQFDVIALVPVVSAKEFAGGLGATLESGKGSCQVEGHTLYLRDIGAGHVAMSPSQAALDAFKPGEKQLASHTSAIGAVGGAIAKDDHVLVIANVPLMESTMKALLQGAGEGAGAEMGMPGMGQMLPMGQSVIDGMTKDVSRMIFGAGVGDAGLWMDFGTQYKDGSQAASMMDAKGSTRALLTKLPGKSFLFAGAFDMSSPGVKKLMSSMMNSTGDALAQGEKEKQERAFESPFSMIAQLPDLADGWGVVIGENPAGMQTGLLSQSAYYVQTKDPAAYLAKMEEWNAATNGLKVDGVTYKSQYAKGTEDVGGVKADTWEVQTLTDKNNPNAMYLNMSQQMLFGGNRMRGYAAPAGQGVVMTMSRNKANLSAAIAAAQEKDGEGAKSLGNNKDIQHAASFLPEGSAAAMFINPKPLFEMASDMMDQIGGPVFDVPERVSPVALGAAMHEGGMHARVFVPGDVLTAVEKIVKSMEEAQAELMAPMDEKGNGGDAPRF